MGEHDTPAARALRLIQQLDEVTDLVRPAGLLPGDVHARLSTREYLIRAEDALGELLGLDCTGEPSSWTREGVITAYSHDGETCPIHEWLVPADQREVSGA